MTMERYKLVWPDYFESYAGVIESKGWFADLSIEIDGQTIRPQFYDPTRLKQEISDEVTKNGYFFETHLIVVDRVCRQSIEGAVASLARSGKLSLIAH